jgi:UDP-N-acetyl-D-mannosaminuronic acid dehydrogenase
MVFELVENDRIIGGMSEACSRRAESLYRLFVRGALLHTKAPVAELVKLIENAYRDVNIAFANELSILCEQMGLNVWEAISLANRHPRVNILNPGPGVGGHCIAVDPWFLISAARDKTPLMSAARQVNDGKPERVLDQIRRQMDRFKRPVVACLGLSYKPDIDDLRESPALHVATALAQDDVNLIVVEPHIDSLPSSLASCPNVEKKDFDEALREADIIVLLVGHTIFKAAPHDLLLSRIVVDTVGLWQG